MTKDSNFLDNMVPSVVGHILIKDKETNEVLLSKQDVDHTLTKEKPLSKYYDPEYDEDEEDEYF